MDQQALLRQYGYFKSDGYIQRLRELWGTEWFDYIFPVYLEIAFSQAQQQGRGLVPYDVLTAHYRNMEGLKNKELKNLVRPDERLDNAFPVGDGRFTGRLLSVLFITDKRIQFADKSIINTISYPDRIKDYTIEFKPGEAIQRCIEFDRESSFTPQRIWLTNQRLLVLDYNVDGGFYHAEVPLEPGETVYKTHMHYGFIVFSNMRLLSFTTRLSRNAIEIAGVHLYPEETIQETIDFGTGSFFLTGKRLIYMNSMSNVSLSQENYIEVKVLTVTDRPSGEVIVTKKGLFGKCAMRLRSGPEEMSLELYKSQAAEAQKLIGYLASKYS